jgi:hypothetical protein
MTRQLTPTPLRFRAAKFLMWLIAVAPATQAQDVCPSPVVDDSRVHIASASDVVAKRASLIQYIWGQSALPTDQQLTLLSNVDSPIDCSVGLARVDEFRMVLGPTVSGATMPARAWHFVPTAPKHRLVIVHDGHMPENDCTTLFEDAEDGFSPYGLQMTINALLAEGYDVLAVPMPLFQPDDCSQDHNALFDPGNAPAAGGTAMRYFFDPVLRSLNALLQGQTFTEIGMTGLSGGGWTTTVYAAVDPRITMSFPVAGSLPLWMRNPTPYDAATPSGAMGLPLSRLHSADLPGPQVAACGEFGDRENSLPSFYQIAGYPDLYVLGAYGRGRTQVQILNRNDGCCFGQDQHSDPSTYDADIRGYEKDVRAALRRLGEGEFRLEVDEASTNHMISRNAVHNMILGELDGAHRAVGAHSTNHVFKRGYNGNLWHYAGHGWQDLGYPMIGRPAVVENAIHAIDVVVRDVTNEPLHLYYDGTQWHDEALIAFDGNWEYLPDGKIITDPVAVSPQSGVIEVVAFGSDFQAYRWTLDGSTQTLDSASGSGLAVGAPALARNASGGFDIYYRSAADVDPPMCMEQPRVLYRQAAGAYEQWGDEQRIGGVLAGYPVVRSDSGSIRAFSVDTNGLLSQATSSDGGASWQWGAPTAANGVQLAGRVSYPMVDSSLVLYARSGDDDLIRLLYDGTWTNSALNLAQVNQDALAVDSPVAVNGGVFWTGRNRQIWYYDGQQASQLSDDVLFSDGFGP